MKNFKNRFVFLGLMKPKSVFLKKEGFTPKNKVLDFFIVHQDFDYSLKDIARFSEVSYPCMKQLKKELIKGKWIFMTRKVGKAQMYKLNLKNKKVQKFIDFFWSVVNEEVENVIEKKKSKSYHNSSNVSSVSVSAKNF